MANRQDQLVAVPARCSSIDHGGIGSGRVSTALNRVGTLMLLALALITAAPRPSAATAPKGQVTWGVHVSLAPTWFDPAETSGIITPFMVLYALHDAMVKPMPGQPMAPSLAESWTVSPDNLTYEFVLRSGTKFHDGAPVTAEDVKFSFERYRGASARLMKERVVAIETPDARHVRFRLKAPWPDFLTFYATASGAGWIVPKHYVEKVGEDGFKKAPIGAGPYKFQSFTPGVELVAEAFEHYWRKQPSVKRLVLRSIPDEATRLAALKRGEVDIVYVLNGALAEEVQQTPGLRLQATVIDSPHWLYFPDQWDPASPWRDERVRRAASLAVDRAAINQALTLGHSRITGSIVPEGFSYYWQPPAPVFDRAKAKQLLAEAGYPNGFDAGEYFCDSTGGFSDLAEAVINDLKAVGIRVKLRPFERAAFVSGYAEKKFKNLIQGASGAFGNAATRLEAFVVKGGTYAYGNYPDLDAMHAEQAAELDPKRRAAILHKMQQLVHERTIFAPLRQVAIIVGVGPRMREIGLGLIAGYAFSAPYEDVTLRGE